MTVEELKLAIGQLPDSAVVLVHTTYAGWNKSIEVEADLTESKLIISSVREPDLANQVS